MTLFSSGTARRATFAIGGSGPARPALRRVVRASLTVAAIVGLIAIVGYRRDRLLDTSFLTGWTLLAGIVGLMAIQVRKRLQTPLLGSASAWMQFHIYFSAFVMGTFALHVQWRWPSGAFEGPLMALFLGTCASGLYGLYLTRAVPPMLAAIGEQVIFERIPQARTALLTEVETLMADSDLSGNVLRDVYQRHVRPFLTTPRTWRYWFWPHGGARRQALARIDDSLRYLTADQKKIAAELRRGVGRKDDLDFHAAMQGRLKLWVWGHVAAAWALLILGMAHGLTMHAFHGGAR